MSKNTPSPLVLFSDLVPPRTLNTGCLFPGGIFYWNTCSDTWRKQKVRVSGHWHTAAAFEITDRSLKTTPLVFRCLFVVHVLHTILNVVFVCSTSSGLLSMTFDDISEIKSQIHFDLSFWFADQTVRVSCIYLCIYYNNSLQSWLIPKPRWTFSTSRFFPGSQELEPISPSGTVFFFLTAL